MKRLIAIDEEQEPTEPDSDEHIEKMADAFAKMLNSPPYDIKYQLETAYNLYMQKAKELSGVDPSEISDEEYNKAYDIARTKKQDFATLMQRMGIQ